MDKAIRGHDNSRTCQFADIRGYANSQTVEDSGKDVSRTSETIQRQTVLTTYLCHSICWSNFCINRMIRHVNSAIQFCSSQYSWLQHRLQTSALSRSSIKDVCMKGGGGMAQCRQGEGVNFYCVFADVLYVWLLTDQHLGHMNFRGPRQFTHNCNIARRK